MNDDTQPERRPAPDDGFMRRSFLAAVAFTAVVATLAVALPASAPAPTGSPVPGQDQDQEQVQARVQAGTAA